MRATNGTDGSKPRVCFSCEIFCITASDTTEQIGLPSRKAEILFPMVWSCCYVVR